MHLWKGAKNLGRALPHIPHLDEIQKSSFSLGKPSLTTLPKYLWQKCEYFHLRKYDSIFLELEESDDEIFQLTGCKRPCKYKKYNFLGGRFPSGFKSEHYIFSLWAVTGKIKVETEELIYPLSTLVAEFAGTLSLFLGFSFISFWDFITAQKRNILQTFKKWQHLYIHATLRINQE